MTFRATACGTCAAALTVLSLPATAQSLSDTCIAALSAVPITMVVPNRAGGGYDTYARAFTPVLGDLIGTDISVVNMPGGGGRLAYSTVAEQGEDELILLIENFADLVAGTDGDPEVDVPSTAYTALGIIVAEPVAWLGGASLNLADPDLTGIVASGSSVASNLVDIGLAGQALGLETRLVAGYDGSSETSGAILRNEVDMTAQTLTTSLRNAGGTDLEVMMILADQPNDRAPDALLFGGQDGLVATRAEGLSEEEVAARMRIAEQVMSLTTVQRGFATSASVEPELAACLITAAEIAILSDAFAETAEAQGRPVIAEGHEAAAAGLIAASEAFAAIAGDLDGIAAALTE